MNLLHLKYAVEIASTGSITKAAQNLYTSQPNLSRALKELEDSLGIEIFSRTPKGLFPTARGEEFLGYASKILSQVDEVENIFRKGNDVRRFSVSVPRASYISCAFTDFVSSLGTDSGIDVFYKETNAMRTVSNITAGYDLGILRFQSLHKRYFDEMLKDKNLKSELICEFSYKLLMSASHPLADKRQIRIDDLTPYIQIAHADPFVPSLPLSAVQKDEQIGSVNKHIYVFERASQMDVLSSTDNTFMWVSPIPQRLLDRYGLVQRDCPDNGKVYRDILIYKNDYRLTELDLRFIDKLGEYKQQMS